MLMMIVLVWIVLVKFYMTLHFQILVIVNVLVLIAYKQT